jgi:plasmid stabilization system protein ParE
MSLSIRFLHSAEYEADESVVYYERQQPGLGSRFRIALETAIDAISATPQAFPVVHRRTVRRALVDRFPFIVVYQIETDSIVVVSVFHTSRDPLIWQGRID